MDSNPILLNWFAFWILQFLLYSLTPGNIYVDLLFLRLFFIPEDDSVYTISCSAPLQLLVECQAETCMSLKIKLCGFKLRKKTQCGTIFGLFHFVFLPLLLMLLWCQKRCNQCLAPKITRAVSALLDLREVLALLGYCSNKKRLHLAIIWLLSSCLVSCTVHNCRTKRIDSKDCLINCF